jgi:hypothetical protein
MRKVMIVFILGCLPFSQMATVAACMVNDGFENTPDKTKPAPELPLNTLYYFTQ